MVSFQKNTVADIYHGSHRVKEVWHGTEFVYGYEGWFPDPVLLNDPHLNGVRIKVVVNETNPEDRKVFFTGSFYRARITSIDFGDGTSTTTIPEYHQYENGEYWLVIEGYIQEIRGGDNVQPSGLMLANPLVSSNPATDGRYYFFENRLLTELYIGDDVGLQRLDNGAFTGWSAMTKLRLPNTLEEIGPASFEACTAIEVIDLRNCVNLRRVQEYSFDGLTNLRKVILPENLYLISYTFNYCDNLETVVFLLDDFVQYNDKHIGEVPGVYYWYLSFMDCSEDMTLYVRRGKTDLYDYYQQKLYPAFKEVKETNRSLF